MNKNFILLSAGVMLLASSCSNELTEQDINPGNVSDGNARYVTVAISGLPEANSRGDEELPKPDYQMGSEVENKVNSVRFYFFDDNGAAANVKACSDGSYINYFDWTAETDPEINDNKGSNAPNIEKSSRLLWSSIPKQATIFRQESRQLSIPQTSLATSLATSLLCVM